MQRGTRCDWQHWGYYFRSFLDQLKSKYGEEQIMAQVARFFVLSCHYPGLDHDYLLHFLMLLSLDQHLFGSPTPFFNFWDVVTCTATVSTTQIFSCQQVTNAFLSPVSDIYVDENINETSLHSLISSKTSSKTPSKTASKTFEDAIHKMFVQFSLQYPINFLAGELRKISLLDFVTTRDKMQSILYQAWWELQLLLCQCKNTVQVV
jgi:hypothetical protein